MTATSQARARYRWLPAAAAAAVALVVAVVGGLSLMGSSGPAKPPTLHLAGIAGGSVGLNPSAAGAADKGGAPDQGGAPVISGGGSAWQLKGTLPNGPASARAYILPAGAVSRALVSTLGRALGMSGEPQHLEGGWYLVSGTTELSVSELAGRHWIFSNHGCIAGPVLDPQTGTACAIAQSPPPIRGPVKSDVGGVSLPPDHVSPVPVRTPAPLQENVLRRLIRPILDAVGLSPDAVKIDAEGSQRSVVFNPQVADSAVVGLETRVTVGEKGQIVDASGWLATPTAAATYPLISARQGYDQLLRQPQPMMALAMPCRVVPGAQGCAPTPDRVVTGATLGLTQAYGTDRGIVLVPAWLFTVRGQAAPVAVVAVKPAFLAQPEPPSSGGLPDGGAATEPGSSGSAPGSVGGQPDMVGGGIAPNGATEATDATDATVAPIQPGGSAVAPGTKPAQVPR
ncbi:MAG: hypothetical protein ABI662_05140 [Dermatophilaceae bacterium]